MRSDGRGEGYQLGRVECDKVTDLTPTADMVPIGIFLVGL